MDELTSSAGRLLAGLAGQGPAGSTWAASTLRRESPLAKAGGGYRRDDLFVRTLGGTRQVFDEIPALAGLRPDQQPLTDPATEAGFPAHRFAHPELTDPARRPAVLASLDKQLRQLAEDRPVRSTHASVHESHTVAGYRSGDSWQWYACSTVELRVKLAAGGASAVARCFSCRADTMPLAAAWQLTELELQARQQARPGPMPSAGEDVLLAPPVLARMLSVLATDLHRLRLGRPVRPQLAVVDDGRDPLGIESAAFDVLGQTSGSHHVVSRTGAIREPLPAFDAAGPVPGAAGYQGAARQSSWDAGPLGKPRNLRLESGGALDPGLWTGPVALAVRGAEAAHMRRSPDIDLAFELVELVEGRVRRPLGVQRMRTSVADLLERFSHAGPVNSYLPFAETSCGAAWAVMSSAPVR